MKTIRFTASPNHRGAYGCSEPNEQSGEYVPAAVARGLLDACNAYVALFCDSDMRPEDECHELFGQMRAAIDAANLKGAD